ncbi:MAG: hypothetical protein V4556_01050 [Bacteroidota bacterium]
MKKIFLGINILIPIIIFGQTGDLHSDSLVLVNLYNNNGGPNWKNKTNWLSNKPLSTWPGISLLNGRVSEIYLDDNNLTGPIPASIGDLTGLNNLWLSYNNLTGSIPESITNLTDLKTLDLYNNKLTGVIPDSIDMLKMLTHLILGKNQLNGSIPSSLGNLNNLKVLVLSENQFTGDIPSFLGNLINLVSLSLNDNALTGDIPTSFKNLNHLNLIYIQNNQLTGDPSFINEPAQITFPYPEFFIENNKFTFVGMEKIVARNPYLWVVSHSPQAKISIRQTTNKISVSAGGTLSNNTYNWYKDGILIATNIGDSTYAPKDLGIYSVAVTNKIATQLTLYSDSIVPKIITKELCNPVGNTVLSSPLSGTIYQWQYSMGDANFINLSDNSNYTNTNSASLQLNNIPSSLYGYQYRCVVDGINSSIYFLQFTNTWIGINNSSWENPANWDCGTIPDGNTDVVINSGTIIVGQNANCRTLTVKPGANVTVTTGVTLSIAH